MGTAPDIEFVLIGDENLPNGGSCGTVPRPLRPDHQPDPERSRANRHPVSHHRVRSPVRRLRRLPAVPDQPRRRRERHPGLRLRAFAFTSTPARESRRPIHTTTGDTDYYFYPTDNLPLFGPLRTIGVPEPVIDVVEPVAKVLVEQGYDRNIPLGETHPGAADSADQPGEADRRSGRCGR